MTNLSRLLFLFCLFFAGSALSKEIISVGGYVFPPFVTKGDNGEAQGLTLDLINAFNAHQDKYHFEFRFTSPKRRYSDFDRKHFDYIFFENTKWGWENHPVKASKVYLKGGERYIALNKPERDQSYFEQVGNKMLVGILGYHYGFADYVSDQVFLQKRFNIRLTPNHHASIQMILRNLGEVAIVTESYLAQHFKRYPDDRDKILVSDKYDQIYEHTILARHPMTPSIDEINSYLDELESNGTLKQLWRIYGINEK